MAEYIDREKINLFGFYDAGDYSVAMRCIKSLPTADVVKRSKINEAKEIAEGSIRACFKLGLNERAFGMREILEVFERVIGE
jgi:hypothetical protein